MELRKEKRESALKEWREKNRNVKKSERQSFKEYWNDYQEWLKGDKLSRLAKRGKQYEQI